MTKRKKAVLWGSAALLACSAVAIPLAIIYSQRSAASSPTTVRYQGRLAYDSLQIAYGSEAPVDFEPESLPDAENADLYSLQPDKTDYEITRQANDATGPQVGTSLPNLAEVSRYGAGTAIVATFTFSPRQSTSALEVVEVTRVLEIVKASASAPEASQTVLPTIEAAYKTGFAEPQTPILGERSTFTGFTLAGHHAIFKQVPAQGAALPAASLQSQTLTAENWSSTGTYWVGTVIEVRWQYRLDKNNYESEKQEFFVFQDFAVTSKPAAGKPVKNIYQDLSVIHGNAIAMPKVVSLALEGYETTPSFVRAVVHTEGTIQNANSPKMNTEVKDWSATSKWNAGTVVAITYTYMVEKPNYSGSDLTFEQFVAIKPAVTDIPGDTESGSSVPIKWAAGSQTGTISGTSFAYDPERFDVAAVKWYRSDPPTGGDEPSADFSLLAKLNKGDRFVVRFELALNANYYTNASKGFYFAKFFYVVD